MLQARQRKEPLFCILKDNRRFHASLRGHEPASAETATMVCIARKYIDGSGKRLGILGRHN